MKLYNSTMRDSSDALVERFGKAAPKRITQFASVLRPGGKSSTGEQLLIRYGFPHCIVYGYISSGDRSNFLGPFMLVSVFERKYLEDILRRDIMQKEKILASARPVIGYAFGASMKWDEIPFPKMDGTSPGYGVNFFNENVATLEGRSAPQGTQEIPTKPALFVREQTATGRRTMSVAIYFNCFPTFGMHPLTAPQAQEGDWWLRSHGNWHVEQDAQLCNAMLAAELFPSADGKMDSSTVANPVITGMDGFAHKSFKVYSWDTEEKYTVQVLGNNTIVVIKRDKPTID